MTLVQGEGPGKGLGGGGLVIVRRKKEGNALSAGWSNRSATRGVANVHKKPARDFDAPRYQSCWW